MTKKNKGGRPTKFKPEFIEQVIHLCKLGATNVEIAEALNVSLATIKNWMKSDDEFLAAVKEGKHLADQRVAKALFSRAVGCHVPDSDIRVMDGEIVITPLKKHFPPDTTACMAWLHNRDRDNWKPRKAFDDSDSNAADDIVSALSEIAGKLPD